MMAIQERQQYCMKGRLVTKPSIDMKIKHYFALINGNFYPCNVIGERNGKVATKHDTIPPEVGYPLTEKEHRHFNENPTIPILVNNLVWLPKEAVKTAVEWYTLGYKINAADNK